VGALLYYARSVDPTLAIALIILAAGLSTTTSTTMPGVNPLLDYCSIHPEDNIRYFSSDTQLKIQSDASSLSKPKAKSRIGWHFYLGNKNNSHIPPITNDPLLCDSTVLKHVVSSMAEAEVGDVFF
jgi:hypothetical protein